MRTASWILLAVVAALTLLGSLGSTYVAYYDTRDEFGQGGPTLDEVQAWNPDIALAIRGRRATASAYSAAYAVLFLWLVVVPYRRGEVWSWWAILTSSVVLALLIAARVPTLGTRLGVGTGLTQLAIVFVALLLDVRRLRSVPPPSTA